MVYEHVFSKPIFTTCQKYGYVFEFASYDKIPSVEPLRASGKWLEHFIATYTDRKSVV